MTGSEQMHLMNEEREAISILDMRLGNQDRHAGNILIDENGKLIPIDHDQTFSMYKYYAGSCYLDKPLSQRGQEYILRLDLNKDIEILREFNLPENEIENFVVRTIFLKLAAEAHFESPMTIGLLEEIIQLTKLPSGSLGIFFDTWMYRNPLKKILSRCTIPYDVIELKQAFQESFKEYRKIAEKTYLKNTLRSWYC